MIFASVLIIRDWCFFYGFYAKVNEKRAIAEATALVKIIE